MIQRLSHPNMSFKANEPTTAQDGYNSVLAKNSQTEQIQNKTITNFINQIPMQGTGEKLDVIA